MKAMRLAALVSRHSDRDCGAGALVPSVPDVAGARRIRRRIESRSPAGTYIGNAT